MRLQWHPDGEPTVFLRAVSDDGRYRLEVTTDNVLYVVDNETGNVQKEENATMAMLNCRLRELDTPTGAASAAETVAVATGEDV